MKATIFTIAATLLASISAVYGDAHSGRSLKRTVESGGKTRTYDIHLPNNYDEGHNYPTIIAFHGLNGTGEGLAKTTNMSHPRWSSDKIIVYPDGVERRWAGANYSAVSITEDLNFVLALFADIRTDFSVDNNRVYAVGYSNGGGFVDTIACNATVGGEFAAFAPISGAYYTNNDENYESCDPGRALTPVLEIHGDKDQTVRYEGGIGQGGPLPSVPDWLDRWAERNDCGQPKREMPFKGITYSSWNCQGRPDSLRHYKAKDHKHAWPSQKEPAWPVEGNDLIFEFFGDFTRMQK